VRCERDILESSGIPALRSYANWIGVKSRCLWDAAAEERPEAAWQIRGEQASLGERWA